MATNFPGSLDDGTSLPNPTASSATNNPSLSAQQGNQNDAIKAVEAKVGTGASTPSNNTFLIGNGVGSSAFSSLTSAELAARISDETGTGSAVFASTPTLVTPQVNTINEATAANGVTIDGLNIKDSALNTNNSVVTANITNASVTANKLSLGATSSTVATSETTTSTSYTALATAGPSVTVTIGANGIALLILTAQVTNNNTTRSYISYDLSGANTFSASDTKALIFQPFAAGAFSTASAVYLLTGLTAGSTTFTAKYRVSANTGTFQDRNIGVVPL